MAELNSRVGAALAPSTPRRHQDKRTDYSSSGSKDDHLPRRRRMPGGAIPAPTMALILTVLLGCAALAETPQDLFKEGNVLYGEGKFADAAGAYQAAREGGLHHWALYYNLGNAHFKTGRLGKAIGSYERAFRLNSGQRDVIFNLKLASQKAGDPVVPQGALAALAWRLFYSLSINTLTLGVSLLFFASLGGLAWMIIRQQKVSAEIVAAGVLVFSLLAVWLGGRIYLLERPVGVITASPVEVRSGPSTTYPANFTVPEGHRVLILDEVEPVAGWIEIGVPQEGLKGWVPETSIDVL